MAIYIVSYDLINESGSQDYEPLWDEFERLGAQKTQYSVWLINLDNTSSEVRDHFAAFLDKDDRIMVCELTKKHAYINAIGGTKAWLKKNPPER